MNMSKKNIHTKLNPFFLNGKRAMVSLGPLAAKRHCPYRCAFCYVQDDFSAYAKLDVDKIIQFLFDKRSEYDIVYVSGDTDSFAHPRTAMGLDLLYRIAMEFDCDLLFTTRTKFSEENYTTLKIIADEQKRTNNSFYACMSITRYSDNVGYVEPEPIPTPDERIEVLRRLKEIGATTVLAMRPFLPIVDKDDYLIILEKSHKFVDIALGESFFFIRDGKIQSRVFPHGISEEIEKNITRNQKMVFNDNKSLWDVWNSDEYEEFVSKHCKELGIVFAMHSDDAIFEYEQKNRICHKDRNINKNELWDLYDDARTLTGEMIERGKVLPVGRYHLVSAAWIRNSKGQFLISQRHPSKNYPYRWECTGGSVLAGETSLAGIVREVCEELGISISSDNAYLFHQTKREVMQDFYDAWLFTADIPLSLITTQPTEVINVKWVSKDELRGMLKKKEIHPLIDYIDKVLALD
jgi:DNA repair photolyase/8-oxo-dGTP pyrophosphatase MutT (NUDIX family)